MLFFAQPDESAPTLLDLLNARLHAEPDAICAVMRGRDGERAITTREFVAQSRAYAAALHSAGIRRGDLVVLILEHGEDVLFAFWGALLLGAVPSIFPFLTEKLERESYFDSARKLISTEAARVVITYDALEAELRDRLRDVDTVRAIINRDALQPAPADDLPAPMIHADDTAFLQHSSGSTGLQKGVMLSHRAVLNQISAYSEAIRLRRADVIASWLPLYHDMGLIAAFILPIIQGVKLVLMSPFHWVRDPKILLQAITDHRATLCWLPNFAYNFMASRIRPADLQGVDLSSVRALINCSEPVYDASHRAFVARFSPHGFSARALATCYAMAENTFAVTQGGIDAPLTVDHVRRSTLINQQVAHPIAASADDAQAFVSNGRPIRNCDVQIVGEDGATPQAERRVGEIRVRSDCLMTGYYARPDLSASALRDGWYLTGDMGYIADGELYITGRKKDLIIVGGKNIYPQDIEYLLNEIDGLHAGRVTAFGVMNAELGTEDIAIVAEVRDGIDARDGKQTTPIIRAIRGRIAAHTDVTARYVHLVGAKWLIKTSSGKIARAANRDKFRREVLGDG